MWFSEATSLEFTPPAECNEQVNQFPSNSHKKYPTYDAALAAFNSTINLNFPRTDANQLCSHKASPGPTCLGVIAVLIVGILISMLYLWLKNKFSGWCKCEV
jgi:hypothetical protein